jgi:hypothetical protein
MWKFYYRNRGLNDVQHPDLTIVRPKLSDQAVRRSYRELGIVNRQ